MIKIKNQLLKETVWSFLATGIAFVFFISLNIFLARKLGVEGFGTWSFFLSVFTIFLTISYSGIAASSRKFVAQYSQTEKLGAVLKSSLELSLLYGLGFAILLLVIYKPLTSIIDRPDLEILFLAAVPLVLLVGLVEYLKAAFQGLHRLKFNFILNTSEYGLKLFFVLCFLLFFNGLIWIVYSFNLSLLITALTGFFFLYLRFYKKNSLSEGDFKAKILKYSFPLFFVGIGFVIMAELDTTMIGLLSTDVEVGIYTVAKQIIVKLPHIAFAIALGTMPVFAKLNIKNKEKLRALFYKLLKYNSLIFGFIALAILTLSWFFVPLFFGADYTKSALILVLLTPYLVLVTYSIFFEQLLDYQGLARKRALNFAFTIILNVALNLVFIPAYGGIGAAISTSVSYFPYLILNWLEVRKVFA